MAYFAPYIDASGLHMPTFDDRLAELWAQYCDIFDVDAAASSSVPDYQFLSLLARNLDDVSSYITQVYESMNPGVEPDNIGIYEITGYQSAPHASGNALDLLMARYGEARGYYKNKYNDFAYDDNQCRGLIRCGLARRGSVDIMAMEAAVREVFDGGSNPVRVYLNDTDTTDSTGIPPRSVAVVVDSTSLTTKRTKKLAQAIFDHLPPGIRTYGDTVITVKDKDGDPHDISFSKASGEIFYMAFYVTKQAGADEDLIRNSVSPAVVEYVNALPIGSSLPLSRLIGIAYAANPDIAGTYVITSVCASFSGSSWIYDVVNCPWNEYMFAGSKTGYMVTFVFS